MQNETIMERSAEKLSFLSIISRTSGPRSLALLINYKAAGLV
jgi:hypothetical protein